MSDPAALRSHHPNIRVERDGHVVTVTIDRPESKNACTGDMWVAIGATFREVGLLRRSRRGPHRRRRRTSAPAPTSRRRVAAAVAPARSATMTDAMRVLGDVVLAVHDCPVPVVAKVDGLCVGAGLGLALAADLTWCSDRARFSAIFAKRGLSMDFGTSWLLRQRIGVHKAKELAFTGEDGERRRGVRARPRERGGAGRRARRRRRVRSSTTIAAGPPIALAVDEARARQRVDVVARAGARDRGARPERQRAHRRHAGGARRVRRAPPAEVHGR